MIVVVGAGLAGLTAAIHLSERGLDVLLCESHPDFLGGRTRAREPYGFRWNGVEHEHSFDHGQHCFELHAYLASRELGASPPAVARALVEEEVVRAWPELRDKIVHVALGSNEHTFDKQGVGHGTFQPRMRTAVPNLVLYGSWIRTDEAVHDMEKAVVTGLRAANCLLEERGLEPFPVRPLRRSWGWQRLASVLAPALPKPPAVRAAIAAELGRPD
jgi:uncharacterized protein with NAD-binding domain and iron-sulfur cluster